MALRTNLYRRRSLSLMLALARFLFRLQRIVYAPKSCHVARKVQHKAVFLVRRIPYPPPAGLNIQTHALRGSQHHKAVNIRVIKSGA